MLTVAVRKPAALGSKVMVNVVVPPPEATGVVASIVSIKSAAWVPPMVTRGGPPVRFNAAVPELAMVNVFGFVPPATSTFPKSVSSVAEGDASPSAMELLSPETSISGSTPVP